MEDHAEIFFSKLCNSINKEKISLISYHIPYTKSIPVICKFKFVKQTMQVFKLNFGESISEPDIETSSNKLNIDHFCCFQMQNNKENQKGEVKVRDVIYSTYY